MKKVLIAEDDDMVLELTVNMMVQVKIGGKPLDVSTAVSVQEVRDRLKSTPEGFDLIVVDDTLAGGGALAVIGHARASGGHAPVIVMGGGDLKGMHDKYAGLSDVHVVQKPVRLSNFIALVSGLLGGGRGAMPSPACHTPRL